MLKSLILLKQNTALLSTVCLCVCVHCTLYRRDISTFRPILLHEYICHICDDLHVWQRYEIRCKKLWKKIKTQSKLCPGGALSMNGGRTRDVPEATWVGQRLPPEICLFYICKISPNCLYVDRCISLFWLDAANKYITQTVKINLHTMCRNTHALTLTNWRSMHDFVYSWLISFTYCDARDKFQLWSEQLS